MVEAAYAAWAADAANVAAKAFGNDKAAILDLLEEGVRILEVMK